METGTCKALDVGCWLTWVFDEIELFFHWVWGSILDGLVYAFSLIPLPSFLENIPSYTLPSGVAFYAQYFELQFGLEVIVTAYIARFILRRIPGIG